MYTREEGREGERLYISWLIFYPRNTKYKRRVIPRGKLVKLYVRRVDHTERRRNPKAGVA